jgi:outer membrane immunogenic protein
MKKIFLATTALIALASGSAVAADMPVKAVYTPAPVYSWTGCYVGAGFGYRMYDRKHTEYTLATGVPIGLDADMGSRGWLATGQFGCDYQFGSAWVIGAFIDGDWSSIKGTYNLNFANVSGQTKEKSSWAVGGRLGYSVMPGLLTFVSGGWTQARFDATPLFNNVNGAPLVAGSTDGIPSQTWGGWFIGGGTEYALGFLPGLFWKNEYRFASFNNKLTPFNQTAPNLLVGQGERSSLYSQTIRSELVWRFGGKAPVVAKY